MSVSALLPFEGRISRLQWWGHVIVAVALLAPLIIRLLSMKTGLDLLFFFSFSAATVVGLAAGVIAQWILFVGAAKRLRDRGKSVGWLTLLFVPYLGAAWLFFELGFLPGAPEITEQP